MPSPNLYRRSAECDCDGNAESLQDPAFLNFIHIPPMVNFESEFLPKCLLLLTIHILKHGTKHILKHGI